jgi:O-antigen ligase
MTTALLNAESLKQLIWAAGAVHLGIIAANFPLPGRLQVRQKMAGVPKFVRQIFYVHWVYIVIVLALFAALCFGFAPELAGASPLGRFLSAFIAAFWLLRIVLQIFYYDPQIRRDNRTLDSLYIASLFVLVAIFSSATLWPNR